MIYLHLLLPIAAVVCVIVGLMKEPPRHMLFGLATILLAVDLLASLTR